MKDGRDSWWDEELAKVPAYSPCEIMASEDPLFILYVCQALSDSDFADPHDLIDVGLYRQAQGCRSLDCGLFARRMLDCQIRIRRSRE
jgi:hypothetical protein